LARQRYRRTSAEFLPSRELVGVSTRTLWGLLGKFGGIKQGARLDQVRLSKAIVCWPTGQFAFVCGCSRALHLPWLASCAPRRSTLCPPDSAHKTIAAKFPDTKSGNFAAFPTAKLCRQSQKAVSEDSLRRQTVLRSLELQPAQNCAHFGLCISMLCARAKICKFSNFPNFPTSRKVCKSSNKCPASELAAAASPPASSLDKATSCTLAAAAAAKLSRRRNERRRRQTVICGVQHWPPGTVGGAPTRE